MSLIDTAGHRPERTATCGELRVVPLRRTRGRDEYAFVIGEVSRDDKSARIAERP